MFGEIARFEEALVETRKQIRQIQQTLREQTQSKDASILDAHLMVLDDRTFIEEVIVNVRRDFKNIEWVVQSASDKYASVLDAVEDDYLRERVADVKDVARRIIRNLLGTAAVSHSDFPQMILLLQKLHRFLKILLSVLQQISAAQRPILLLWLERLRFLP